MLLLIEKLLIIQPERPPDGIATIVGVDLHLRRGADHPAPGWGRSAKHVAVIASRLVQSGADDVVTDLHTQRFVFGPRTLRDFGTADAVVTRNIRRQILIIRLCSGGLSRQEHDCRNSHNCRAIPDRTHVKYPVLAGGCPSFNIPLLRLEINC